MIVSGTWSRFWKFTQIEWKPKNMGDRSVTVPICSVMICKFKSYLLFDHQCEQISCGLTLGFRNNSGDVDFHIAVIKCRTYLNHKHQPRDDHKNVTLFYFIYVSSQKCQTITTTTMSLYLSVCV